MPDRLPSLVLLVGFCWIPPAIVGFVAADLVHRITTHVRQALIYTLLTIFAVGYAAAWFLFQLDRIPPYVPGATNGSNVRTTAGCRGTAVVSSALVLPGSVLACMLVSHSRGQWLRRTSAARVPT